jgi:ferredoxin-2, mitochondrial
MKVIFISADGKSQTEATAKPGDVLLDIAHAHGQPLEGTCEGAMACSTCHVIVAPDWYGKLGSASDEEDDMLDFAAGVTRTSRLACQIRLRAADDGLTVRIPGDVKNLLGKN